MKRLTFMLVGFMLLVALTAIGCGDDAETAGTASGGGEAASTCIDCHTSETELLRLATEHTQAIASSDDGWSGDMPSLEAWEKVLLDDSGFLESTHGIAGCMICHEGDGSAADKESAHTGLVADPSDDSCDTCHREIAEANSTSLHSTLNGFANAIEARGGNLGEGSALAEALNDNCNGCHTTCGGCHVSRPDQAGGGLVSDHAFTKTPSMEENCTACHGSRVGDEYLGNNPNVSGDVHWVKVKMSCTMCHGEELHGTGVAAMDRYSGSAAVRCETCHGDVAESNSQHQLHVGTLSCQVCHSVDYKNCYGCHVDIDRDGTCSYEVNSSDMDFKIGLNPLQSDERPYEYVVLRHVPVSASTFDAYGENLLPNFEAAPTWKYATPHNIQLSTPQNEGCGCHMGDDIYLMADDIAPDELAANGSVVVEESPQW